MKYTAIVALTMTVAQAGSYFPNDPADLAACDTDDNAAISEAELKTCLSADLGSRATRRFNRRWDEMWASWDSNADGVFDEDETKAVYYNMECSESGSSDDDADEVEARLQRCSLGWVHHWFGDDLTTCAAGIDGEGCVTVPVGSEFTADLHLAKAFAAIDADADDAWSSDEQAQLAHLLNLSNINQWAPEGDWLDACDTDESELTDGTGFSGDLSSAELEACWSANVPDCLADSFAAAYADVWTHADGDTSDALDADEISALRDDVRYVSSWHSSDSCSSSDDDCEASGHSACPPEERRLFSTIKSFFNF